MLVNVMSPPANQRFIKIAPPTTCPQTTPAMPLRLRSTSTTWRRRGTTISVLPATSSPLFCWQALVSKKIEKESAVCRRTALFLRNFRWQTRNTDNSGQKQRKARYTPRDKTVDKILEKAAVRTTWVESPYHIPLRSSFRTVETSRQYVS
jgi:hypothetical protein